MKRGIIGTFHNVSAEYLPLYLAEFTFRHNFRQEHDPFALLIRNVSSKQAAARVTIATCGKRKQRPQRNETASNRKLANASRILTWGYLTDLCETL